VKFSENLARLSSLLFEEDDIFVFDASFLADFLPEVPDGTSLKLSKA